MAWSNAGIKGAPDAGACDHTGPLANNGVAILDEGYRPVALDSGARAIFETLDGPNNGNVPEAVLSRLQSRRVVGGDVIRTCLSAGGCSYSWRTFVVKPRAGGDAMLTLYFRREATVMDAVRQIAADYRLSDREQEALAGLLTGMTGKELAAQMRISHNTVKALVRLAMIKMGVHSRAHLFSKMLDTQPG